MIAVNPVLVREMRSRMRGRRAAVLLTFWLATNGGVLAVVYLAAENVAEQRFGFGGFANTVSIGRGIYDWTLFGMLLLMLLIVPAQAAGAIAGERERQTLVPLQVTLLSPGRILLGKVAASIAFLVLLVVAAVPLLAVGYLVGGIGIVDVAIGAATVLAAGFVVAGLCISVSTFARRVQSATVLCYTLVLALSVGTLLAYGAYAVVDQSRGSDVADPPDALLLLNPVVAVSDVVGDFDATEMPSPFDGLFRLVNDVDDAVMMGNPVPAGPIGVGPDPMLFRPDLQMVDDGLLDARRPQPDGVRFWAMSGIALLSCAAGALALATRRLRTPAETER